MDSAEATLRTLGIQLPDPPKALASYVPLQQVGELLYTSGVIPVWNGEIRYRGMVGGDLSLRDGVQAAEMCALNIISLVRQHTGSLDRVEQFATRAGRIWRTDIGRAGLSAASSAIPTIWPLPLTSCSRLPSPWSCHPGVSAASCCLPFVPVPLQWASSSRTREPV